ncbi:MAG: NAD(P)H-dependent oxidoreductase subunit E, partial [Nitrospirota bacterium]
METYRAHLMICGGTGCIASGGLKVKEALEHELRERGLQDEFKLVLTGCNGFCAEGPIMTVYPEGIFYEKLKPEDMPFLVEEHLLKGRPVEKFMYKQKLHYLAIIWGTTVLVTAGLVLASFLVPAGEAAIVPPESQVTDGEDAPVMDTPQTIYEINPELCTECVGYFDEPQCRTVCPVPEVLIVNPDHVVIPSGGKQSGMVIIECQS